VTQKTNRR